MNKVLLDTIINFCDHNGCDTFTACAVVGISYGDFVNFVHKEEPSYRPMVTQLDNQLPTKQQVLNIGIKTSMLTMLRQTNVTRKTITRRNQETGLMELDEIHETLSPAKPNYPLINGIILSQFQADTESENLGFIEFEEPNGAIYSIGC